MADATAQSDMPRYLGISLNNLMSMLRPMGQIRELLASPTKRSMR
ncbi:MAG: hypothetical protein KatS3mg065_0893 [Chloroflexota bacterium]|nr:MAG: hypothetical protein KatS3mg065_0893 [Chloroflexota bacterium]